MKINKYFKLITLIVALGFGFSTYAKDKKSPMEHHMTSEQHFIEMMRMHHEGGIEMAQLALEKSQNAEIKKVSQKIIDAQTSEVAQFTKWKNKWYPKTDMKMDMPMMDLSTMKSKSGKEFDSEYLKMMSMHHEGAIKMAKEALPNIRHREIKVLAEKIVQDQSAEITHLNEMQKSL